MSILSGLRPRILVVVAAVLLASLAAAGFWAWHAYATRGLTRGPHVALCPGEGGCVRVHDIAGVLPKADVPRFEDYLRHIQRESDVDARLVFVRDSAGRRLEDLAVALVEEMGIGARTREERGLLLLYDLSTERMKIEVGYGLEGIFPDAFVSYLVERHARQFFAAGTPFDKSVGLRLMLRLLQHRVREAVLGQAFDPAWLASLPRAAHLSGGAGVTAKVPRGGTGAAGKGSGTGQRFDAQDSPRGTYARYLDWLATLPFDPEADFLTEDSKRYVARFPMSPAYAEFILLGELGRRYAIVERGDLAVLYFTGTPFTSPHFFVRERGRWLMDIVTEVRNTKEYAGGRFNWGYVGKGDPHSVAFADLLVNLRGVIRFRDGDNREIPVRGP